MQTIIYKENAPAKALRIAALYLALVALAIYFIGWEKVRDFVNSGPSKGVGFLAGIISILPIFSLVKFVQKKITVTIHEDQLAIKSKDVQRTIVFNEVEKVTRNLNSLDFYGKNGAKIFKINPFSPTDTVQRVVDALKGKVEFRS